MAEAEEVWLREVDAGTDNACWLPAAQGDPGAVRFVPALSDPGPQLAGGELRERIKEAIKRNLWYAQDGPTWLGGLSKAVDAVLALLPVPDGEGAQPSNEAELLAYHDMHEHAVMMGYPSILEALEHLQELTGNRMGNSPDPEGAEIGAPVISGITAALQADNERLKAQLRLQIGEAWTAGFFRGVELSPWADMHDWAALTAQEFVRAALATEAKG